MKIMKFVDKKWVEVKNAENFDTFLIEIVWKECPFIFTDCTEEEKDDYIDRIGEESTALDDCDYYRFNCDDESSVDEIFIFDDLVLCTLDRVIRYYERVAENFRKIKKQIDKT